MSVQLLAMKTVLIPSRWRARLMLLFIVACFAVPLAGAWLLVGRWQPGGSVQHGELLHPARPVTRLRFVTLDGQKLDALALRGYWVLAYVGAAGNCEVACRTALYDLRQVRLASGKDMERVKTLLLLDEAPDPEFRHWLRAEHAAMIAGVADPAARSELARAFPALGAPGEWIYLLDPLGNLLMRYPVGGEPRGMLKDLQRLLRLSGIG